MLEHRRRSIRLRGYDYTQAGAYFITICAQNRTCLFGGIREGILTLSPAGTMVQRKWLDIPRRFPVSELGPFIIMPNHFHGVILLNAAHPNDPLPSEAPAAISAIIQWFKTGTTYDYIEGVNQLRWLPFDRRLWQRNYWEHIVRNDQEYDRLTRYIEQNPSSWHDDSLHPSQAKWLEKGRPSRNRPSSP